MGINEEDIARVRAASDFVAVAAEHIALKRVGRNYSGLCPFHSEKSPSFSINPEKGVYFCYGCGAKGDVITFVRDLERLDFAAAVERLAAKANIQLRYDNEAAGRDRIRRTKLLEAVASAADWYHQRLLTSADAGRARSYLRSRGYDGEAIRRFKLGWAPDGWDVMNRALNLPTDVARDSGLGYVSKIGKLNDFFQSRILFPIFDPSGAPIAFGGRKLPDADGPKYKNSSESKVYSKSRTLYGLNWAKAGIVEAGEVIVCEGYTDVIGFHRAGLVRAVATCGTALADEHFRMLKNYARRIVLAYDADNAGQNAAEKFYAWEKAFEIDLTVVALPAGKDPGDVAREQPELLAEAVANAKPFLQFRIERLLGAANLRTPEGRARVYEAASDAILEHPNPLVREQYLRQVAAQCQISEDTMARTLSEPRRKPGGRPAEGRSGGGRDREERGGSSRPASGGAIRPIANEDPGSERPPDATYPDGSDGDGHDAAGRGTSAGMFRAAGGPRPAARPAAVRGKASSASTRGQAASSHASPAEQEALRWALLDPSTVLPWLDASFFADVTHGEAFDLLVAHGDLREAADAVELEPDESGVGEGAIRLLHRLAVANPVTEAQDASALIVANATSRAIAAMSGSHREATVADVQNIQLLKLLSQGLHEPQSRPDALSQLVPWLAAWARQQRSETFPPTT